MFKCNTINVMPVKVQNIESYEGSKSTESPDLGQAMYIQDVVQLTVCDLND